MIEVTRGNLLTSEAEALVNTVNTVGVMGKGIALQFKRAWPDYFRAYKQACDAGQVELGRVWVYPVERLTGPRYIISFPTKGHWRERSMLENIEAGLIDLVEQLKQLDVRSVAVPPLGCGQGGLDWSVVRKRIETACEGVEGLDVLLFEPGYAPPHRERPAAHRAAWRWTEPRAALATLMDAYRIADYRLSHLEAQKLAYFLQEAGVPMKLRFKAAHYGPYADNLRHLLITMEGQVLFGADGSSAPDAKLELIETSLVRARQYLGQRPALAEQVERVRGLIEGFETPYGMELLATVHWIARDHGVPTVDEALERVRSWSDAKRARFGEHHVRTALQQLQDTDWIPLPA